MTREEIESREDESMMDAPQINKPKPEEFFNVNYLRIYYGKSPFSFFLTIKTFDLLRKSDLSSTLY